MKNIEFQILDTAFLIILIVYLSKKSSGFFLKYRATFILSDLHFSSASYVGGDFTTYITYKGDSCLRRPLCFYMYFTSYTYNHKGLNYEQYLPNYLSV